MSGTGLPGYTDPTLLSECRERTPEERLRLNDAAAAQVRALRGETMETNETCTPSPSAPAPGELPAAPSRGDALRRALARLVSAAVVSQAIPETSDVDVFCIYCGAPDGNHYEHCPIPPAARALAASAPPPATPPPVVRREDTPEAREFWASAEWSAAEVESWPDWKRAGINEATERTEPRVPPATPEPAPPDTVYGFPRAVPHYAADGTLKHHCTRDHCPDMDENSMRAAPTEGTAAPEGGAK